MSPRVAGALALAALLVAGCGHVARTFLDLPATPAPRRPQAAAAAAPHPIAAHAAQPAERPAIEATLDPDSVLAMLPRDHAGHVDWVAALRSDLIRPRDALDAAGTGGSTFAYDFFFPGPDTTYDAWFPHSVHAGIMDCRQCHGRVIRYQREPISMGDIFAGKYCAECHGKVSFPVMTGCDRCHTRLELPAGRVEPELLGTVTMARVAADSGFAAGVAVDSLPPARFPHWVHRIRYTCRTCHVSVFEPRAGANAVTMRDLAAGRACGRCHDGTTAFRAGFGACDRCHVAAPAGESP